MRKTLFKAIFAAAAAAALLCAHVAALAADPFPKPKAASALLVEADSGTTLYSYNSDIPRQPYDLVKVMTLLMLVTACESGAADPEEIVEMTESAYFDINPMSTTQDISPGESMTLLDLMYCAYIGGANEACNLLAEHLSGSVSSFVRSMNARAKELGCQDSNFTNTHGQYDAKQKTTAADQFIIFREAMDHALFVEISETYKYNAQIAGTSERRTLTSSNALLNSKSKYYYRQCTAGMPSPVFEVGYGEVAEADGGYSFVSFAESGDLSLIGVVIGSRAIVLDDESAEMQNLTETIRLFDWGFANFSHRTVLSTNPVAKAPVMHVAGVDFVNLRPEYPITLLLDNDISDEDFEQSVTIYSEKSGETLYAPVGAGDVLGEITLSLGDKQYGPVFLVANTSIELNRLQFVRMQMSDMLASRAAHLVIWILVMLVLGYVALVIRYNILRRRHLQRIAEARAQLVAERRGVDRELWSEIKENESEATGLGTGNRKQGSGVRNQGSGIRGQESGKKQ